jgi:hypothetical protein
MGDRARCNVALAERVEHDHGAVGAHLGVMRPWQCAQSTTLAGEQPSLHADDVASVRLHDACLGPRRDALLLLLL